MWTKALRTLGGSCLVLACLVAPSFAHHSFAAFNMDQTLSITGTVKDFEWTNPHCWIVLQVLGTDGTSSEWRSRAVAGPRIRCTPAIGSPSAITRVVMAAMVAASSQSRCLTGAALAWVARARRLPAAPRQRLPRHRERRREISFHA